MESSLIRKTLISGYSLGSPNGSLCIRGLSRIRSPPVSGKREQSHKHSRICFAWKGFAVTQGGRSTGQQPGTKSGVRPWKN